MIYIVTTESFPNGFAATRRIRCYAKALAKKSKCKVIVANRCEDSGKPLGNTEVSGMLDGYEYEYVGSSTAKPRSSVGKIWIRFLDTLSLCFSFLVNLKSEDRIIFYSYSIPLMRMMIAISHFKSAKIYYELCEHPSVQCKGYPVNLDSTSQIKWVKKYLGKFDGIFCISHPLQQLVEDIFRRRMPTILVPILYESESPKSIVGTCSSNRPYIIHTGSLTQQKDGVLYSLEAFAKAKVDMDYVMTGDLDKSPDKNGILQIIKQYRIENKVKFLGFVSNEDMVQYQKNAYMTIVNKVDNLQNRYCFATKIGEYLRSGCLLLASRIGEHTYYLVDNEDCLFYDSDNIDELSGLIIWAYSHKDERDRLSNNGQIKARQLFNCENYTELIYSFVI